MGEGWHLLVYLLVPLTVLVVVAALVTRAAGKHQPPHIGLPNRSNSPDSNEPPPRHPPSDG